MPSYIHQLPEWPDFKLRANELLVPVARGSRLRGELRGRIATLGLKSAEEARAAAIAVEAVKSSEIEGERFDLDAVRSSIANRLGLADGGPEADHAVEGIVEMALDVADRYASPLTQERLFDWHGALFPTGRNPVGKITVGAYRDDHDGPMRVVSKAGTKNEKIHFEAPSAPHLSEEMALFLRWFEESRDHEGSVKSALAHLWYVTIHPFEDGNGRIGRAILDLALARDDDDPRRAYSVSAQIQKEKRDYYAILERTQKGDLDVTDWVVWSLGCLARAVETSLRQIDGVIRRERFWAGGRGLAINERQRKIVDLVLDGAVERLDNKRYRRIAGVSDATASRDLAELADRHVLVRYGEGRGVFYEVVSTEEP